MVISRVMHRSEVDAFKRGKNVLPQRKTYIGSCDNSTADKGLKDGCLFFAKGDAREYRFDELGQLFTMTGSKNKVLAVFEIDENTFDGLFEGTAIIHTGMGGEVEVPEIYIKAYSKRNARLLWVDWKWNLTCSYLERLESSYGKVISTYDEYDGCDYEELRLSVPRRFQQPYHSRSKKIMNDVEVTDNGREPDTLAIFPEFMVI